MPKMKVTESADFEETQGPLLTPGEIYEATVTGFNQFDGKFGATIAWQLEIDDEEFDEPVEAVIFTSTSTNLDGSLTGDKTSNLLKYAGAFNGGTLPSTRMGTSTMSFSKGRRRGSSPRTTPRSRTPRSLRIRRRTCSPCPRRRRRPPPNPHG